jgi:hypothetical protein
MAEDSTTITIRMPVGMFERIKALVEAQEIETTTGAVARRALDLGLDAMDSPVRKKGAR